MIERCHPIMEQILIESFLDGVDRLGETFATILQQDLSFEQKGRIIDVIGFEIIENALPYIEDPENLQIDEASFDFCLSKILLSEVLTELVANKPNPSQMSLRQRHHIRTGRARIRSGIKISRAADAQIAKNKERLFSGGKKGSVADSLRTAGTYAKSGNYLRAGANVVGGAYRAGKGALGLATGGARKLLSKAVISSGKGLKASPYQKWQAQQRLKKAKEDIDTRRQRYANVPGV